MRKGMKSGRAIYQSDPSYMATLYELRRRQSTGVPVAYYDDDTIGSKNTECTLGLCDDQIQAKQDGVYSGPGHVCPHDSRYFEEDGTATRQKRDTFHAASGCFYSCHIFKKGSITKEAVGARIEAAIKQGEETYEGHFFTEP